MKVLNRAEKKAIHEEPRLFFITVKTMPRGKQNTTKYITTGHEKKPSSYCSKLKVVPFGEVSFITMEILARDNPPPGNCIKTSGSFSQAYTLYRDENSVTETTNKNTKTRKKNENNTNEIGDAEARFPDRSTFYPLYCCGCVLHDDQTNLCQEMKNSRKHKRTTAT